MVGVNTFENPDPEAGHPAEDALIRSSNDEKDAQLASLAAFHARWDDRSPEALARLADTAVRGGNIFEELMDTVKTASLGQISNALFEVGGRYRRSM